MIPYNRHNLFPQDKTLIKNLLNGNFLTQGPLVDKFENIIKKYVNSKYAIATTNASTALHCACASLDIGDCAHKMFELKQKRKIIDMLIKDFKWYGFKQK